MAYKPTPIGEGPFQALLEIARPYLPQSKPKTTGRPPLTPRQYVTVIVHKLKTGDGWTVIHHGHATYRIYQAMPEEAILAFCHTMMDHAEELGLTPAHLAAMERYLKERKAISGEPIKPAPKPKKSRYVKRPPREKKERKSRAKPPRRKKATPEQNKRDKSRKLPTITETDDLLWSIIEAILLTFFPPAREGAPRTVEWRSIFDGIIFHARSGCAWKLLPATYGSDRTVRRWKRRWEDSGAMAAIHRELISESDKMGLIDWDNCVVDGSLVKARRGGDNVGESPVDRGKPGSKISVISDGNGLPLGAVVAGANIPDVSLLEATLAVGIRPERQIEQKMLLDRGYRGQPARLVVEAAGYVYKEPRKSKKSPYYEIVEAKWSQAERIKRSKIEPGHAWMQNFRGILTRYEVNSVNYMATIHTAMICIIWRRIMTEIAFPRAAA